MSVPVLPLPERWDLAHAREVLRVWASRFRPLLELAPVARGRLLPVSLASGAQEIEHGLGRAPQGWILVAPRSSATLYQHAAANRLRLPLTTSAALDASLWIW